LFLPANSALADSKPVTIDGLVKQPRRVTATRCAGFGGRAPRDVRDRSGRKSATYTGVLLWTLIDRAKIDDAAKWGERRHVIAVTAAEGYLLMVSVGEIDPNFGNAPAMLASRRDDQPLPALRLVFPGDKHGARDVRDVVRIEVR
jgi:hypothetical protein